RHVAAGEAHRAGRGLQLAAQGAQQRGLAHAVVAEHADDLALPHRQRHALQDGDAPVAGAQALDGEDLGASRAARRHGRRAPYRLRASTATTPPPGGPWCSAPAETYAWVSPVTEATTALTAPRIWRV